MNAREMYNTMKEQRSIWSNSKIRRRIRELGHSVSSWTVITVETEEDDKTLFRENRGSDRIIDENFDPWVSDCNGIWRKASLLPSEASSPHPAVPQEYFTPEENARILAVNARHSINMFYGYHHGSCIYNELGVFRAGVDDGSPTVGFEIETMKALGCWPENDDIAHRVLDRRLGHLEADGSINGVEFDSHIFTWNKLKKIRPLVEKQLNAFVNAGLSASEGAGLHIHIGRNAFVSTESFQAFYYVINRGANQRFWEAVARREETSYCRYRGLEDGGRAHLLRSIQANRGTHEAAVNQQHDDTYEVRIFQSTLSVDVLYGCIEVLLNLVELCNRGAEVILTPQLFAGEYAPKYGRMINIAPRAVTTDLTFLRPMTLERLRELVNEALRAGNTLSASQLINQFNTQRSAA